MARKYFNGGTSNFQTGANWGGSAPANDDELIIDRLLTNIDAGLSNTSLTGMTVRVGPNYSGLIGTSGGALSLGLNTTIDYDGRNCPSAYLSAATSGNTLKVRGTSLQANALVVSGVWANVYVESGNVIIAASATVGVLHVIGENANVTVQAGATITTHNQDDGRTTTAAAATTTSVWGGTWHAKSDSALTYGTVNVNGGTARFHVKEGVVSTLNANAGHFTTVGDLTAKTISAGTVRKRAYVDLRNGDATTAALIKLGGVIKGGANVTITPTISEAGEPGPM